MMCLFKPIARVPDPLKGVNAPGLGCGNDK
jgi:hypothetical protein